MEGRISVGNYLNITAKTGLQLISTLRGLNTTQVKCRMNCMYMATPAVALFLGQHLAETKESMYFIWKINLGFSC